MAENDGIAGQAAIALSDLHTRWQRRSAQVRGQWDGKHRGREAIDGIVLLDQHRSPPGLFRALRGIEFRRPNLTASDTHGASSRARLAE